jgi:predicted RNA-binding protein YlqC (UPF0109 family)
VSKSRVIFRLLSPDSSRSKVITMKELVEYIVKSMADHPEDVLLTEQENEGTVFLELKIASDDFGKIIGRNGNTINAIRTVVQVAASSRKKRARLDIVS